MCYICAFGSCTEGAGSVTVTPKPRVILKNLALMYYEYVCASVPKFLPY